MDNSSSSPPFSVLEQLRGKHVLVTGTTGFLGKVILEKLMRAVPDIGGIHLLIRGNARHRSARDRFMGEIAGSSIFDRARETDPEGFEQFCEERIHCVTGEITAPLFGLPTAEFNELAGRLDAIVNSAASVNFREELDRALSINALCLKNILALSAAGDRLPVIQVSTCYVNGFNRGHITESVAQPARARLPRGESGAYSVDGLLDNLDIKIAALQSHYRGKALGDKLVDLGIREARAHGWNDTYTFTKWLGEQLLLQEAGGTPVTILRPSIIESTWQEPTPGWIEGVKVADAILLAYARQKVTFFPCKRSGIIDVIPADLVANAVTLSLAEQLTAPAGGRIYQCCSGSRNPLQVGQLIDHLMCEAAENHSSYQRLFPQPPRRRFVPVNRHVFNTGMAAMRTPLSLVDRTLRLMGRNPELRALKNLNLATKLSAIYSFYATPSYIFHNDRLLALAERLSAAERELFPIDPQVVDWERYLRKVHMAGINNYALSDRGAVLTRPRERAREAA